MRIVRLEDAKLLKVSTVIGEDGDPMETYEEINSYKIILEYVHDDVVTTTLTVRDNYTANIEKIYRVSSVHNALEKYLLPKNNNEEDNISNYLLEYNGGKYRVEKVTPRYINITWR